MYATTIAADLATDRIATFRHHAAAQRLVRQARRSAGHPATSRRRWPSLRLGHIAPAPAG